MCKCKDIDIGTYENQVKLKCWWSDKTICVDFCLKDEILNLWKNKIITTGCCCGHNKLKPFINVDNEHHNKMIDLNYKHWINEFNAYCYEPKTI